MPEENLTSSNILVFYSILYQLPVLGFSILLFWIWLHVLFHESRLENLDRISPILFLKLELHCGRFGTIRNLKIFSAQNTVHVIIFPFLASIMIEGWYLVLFLLQSAYLIQNAKW